MEPWLDIYTCCMYALEAHPQGTKKKVMATLHTHLTFVLLFKI